MTDAPEPTFEDLQVAVEFHDLLTATQQYADLKPAAFEASLRAIGSDTAQDCWPGGAMLLIGSAFGRTNDPDELAVRAGWADQLVADHADDITALVARCGATRFQATVAGDQAPVYGCAAP